MNEQPKQPLTDDQLSALLRKWDVAAPPDLEARLLAVRPQPRRSPMNWWRFLLRGSIPVPVPVACCLVLVLALVLWRSSRADISCVAAVAPPAAVAVAPTHASLIACPADSGC
jgi:hypothetical protein